MIDVPRRLDDRIKAILTNGEYTDLNQFALVAIENQIVAESAGGNPWEQGTVETSKGEEAQTISVQNKNVEQYGASLVSKPAQRPILVNAPEENELFKGPLWGQYYKFLPAKVSLRVLAAMSKDSPPNYGEFRQAATEVAVRVGQLLAKRDKKLGRKFGEELFTCFPMNTDKSRGRFMNQYVVYRKPSTGKIDGLPAKMKWLKAFADNGSVKVGITKDGYEFAMIDNPVLDAEGNESLSHEEKEFILSNITLNNEDEATHIFLVLDVIASGVSSRELLNQTLSARYAKRWNGAEGWSAGVVNTYRAGAISRLYELGLIEKSRNGLTVAYKLSQSGLAWLDKLRATLKASWGEI